MTDMVERFDKAALDWGWTQDWGTRGEEIQRSRSEYESAKAALIGEIKRQRADIASLTASLAAEVSESERLRSEIAALRASASQVCNQVLEEAATICHAEGDEWDSDNLKTYKNYAHTCRDAIRALKDKADD